MADKIYDVGRFRHSIDNWQLSMLLGIIFFIVGIVVFFEPGGTYLALSVLFGIVVILSGAFELYLGTKAPTGSGKGWYIAGGVVEILLGILLLCTPSMLFTILPFVLGFWLLFRGFMAVGVASEMMGVGIKGAGWTMTLGILVIISAFLVLFNPIIGVGVVVFWVGLSLLLAGVDLIAHAVTLRRLRKELSRSIMFRFVFGLAIFCRAEAFFIQIPDEFPAARSECLRSVLSVMSKNC